MKFKLMNYIAGISLAAVASGCVTVSNEIFKQGNQYANSNRETCTTEYGNLSSRIPKEFQPQTNAFVLFLENKDQSIEATLVDGDSLELKVIKPDLNLASETNGLYVSLSDIYYDFKAKGKVKKAYLGEPDLAPGVEPNFSNANLIHVVSDSKNSKTQRDFKTASSKFLYALRECNNR